MVLRGFVPTEQTFCTKLFSREAHQEDEPQQQEENKNNNNKKVVVGQLSR